MSPARTASAAPAALAMVALALALPACSRQLEDGPYDFVAVEVRQDSCSTIEPLSAGDIWDGRLHVSGDTIRIEYNLHSATGGRALIGRFLEDPEKEQFIADATFDVQTQMGADANSQPLSCLAFAHLHIHAFVDAPTVFHGQLRVEYTRRSEAAPGCLPACVLDIDFKATKIE